LIITGFVSFSKTDQLADPIVLMQKDSIPSLQRVVDKVHGYGTKIVAQLNHAGSQASVTSQETIYAPSAVKDPATGIVPTPLSTEQVKELVKEFAAAAVIAKEAGFDGVQMHGAHGYLLNKFLSPVYNNRTDEYGGDFSGRSRIVMEIAQEIKRKAGKDYPVWIKLNNSDYHRENLGVTEEEFLALSEELSRIGVDAIEVSGGTITGTYGPSRSKQHTAYHLEAAKRLAEKVEASVILVGGIRDVEMANSILLDTKIAAISLCRALICEPDLIKKWRDGEKTTADCISCNRCFNPLGKCIFKFTKEEKIQYKAMRAEAKEQKKKQLDSAK